VHACHDYVVSRELTTLDPIATYRNLMQAMLAEFVDIIMYDNSYVRIPRVQNSVEVSLLHVIHTESVGMHICP